MGLFKSLFSSPANPVSVESEIVVDVHSHLIPGIDDGSPDMQSTLVMLERYQALGYKKIVTTPHVMIDFYKNDSSTILDGLAKVRDRASEEGIQLEIDAAAEYYADSHLMQLIEMKDLLTFGENYVLVEQGFNEESPYMAEAIFELQTQGYKPMLAHIERYPFYFDKIEKVEGFKDRGAHIQLNINSLSGHYGSGVKKMAEKLIDRGLVDLIGSDCHRIDHLDTLERTLSNRSLGKLIDSGKLINKSL